MLNISHSTVQLLNEQIVREGFNSNRYALIGAALINIGLNNIGNYFAIKQRDEEREHQDKIRKYLTDRNEQVLSLPIPEFAPIDAKDLVSIGNIYVQAEKETTSYLKEIAFTAFEEQDLLTFNFITELLLEQRAQEEEAITFLDQAKMTANAPEVALLWDANFSIGG